MAYYDALSEQNQTRLYKRLGELISQESQCAYESRVARATTTTAKNACAGAYEGSWFRLREAWLNNQVSNLHVMDCINLGRVIGDTEGIGFTAAPRLKPSRNQQSQTCM